MSNSPTPNRRRRLTADELIAIVVALAGIGTIFFWGIGQKNSPLNMLQGGISNTTGNNGNRQAGILDGGAASTGKERRTIANIDGRERRNPVPATITSPIPATIVAAPVTPAIEAPATTPVPAPVTSEAIAPVIPVVPVVPVVPPVTIITPAPIAKTPTFTDVPKQFWGKGYIAELQKRGILDDFGDGKFDPTKPITRGEYAKMLDRAFADKPASTAASTFQDIPADYPRKEAVDKSVQLGFMTGYSPSKFAPNESIPRYQMQISLAKGLQLPTPNKKEQDRVLKKFTDAKQMPKYAREKAAAAVKAELIVKDRVSGKLKPAQNATRADAAALIYQALVKEGKIQSKLQP